MIFYFSIVLSPFRFMLIEFHCTFSIYFIILPYYVYHCIYIGY